jgi:hypothetical protein
MIDPDRLKKLSRIAENIRALSALTQKEDRSSLHAYKKDYDSQYKLLIPILNTNSDYELEFQSLRKPENVSYTEIKPAFTNMSVLVDSVCKQEILGDRIQSEMFKNEYFIDENRPFTSYNKITDIVDKSVSSLKIVDNYAESKTLDFFQSVNTQVEIKIVTMNCKPNNPAFKIAVSKFISEWGGKSFEVKESKYFHDRFIIIDNSQVWHLGPSLNNLGKKPMMISQVRDLDVRDKIIEVFDNQWIVSTLI